uniref:Uncharacterized protein n=1 Tax=Accipiter nisus TaxID=211598 RepID=A0A8B9RYH2_9AVES
MAPAAVQPPEIQFAQRLAANEKRIRDRALKKLRGYIGVRTQRPAGRARRGGGGPAWPGRGTAPVQGGWRTRGGPAWSREGLAGSINGAAFGAV